MKPKEIIMKRIWIFKIKIKNRYVNWKEHQLKEERKTK